MLTDENMPLSALPYFLRITRSFCHALDESIALFKEDQDHEAFSKVLDHLSNDLHYYLNVYEHWQNDPEASIHQADLKTLGTQLHEAQNLLSSALGLIRH